MTRPPRFLDHRGRPYRAANPKREGIPRWALGIVLAVCLAAMGAATQINLQYQVQGVLPVANGGTGAATFSAHNWFGNNTGSTAAPAAALIGTSDVTPNEYITGSGSATAFTATMSPAVPALSAGLYINLLSGYANSGAGPTLALNGLTAKTITKCGTTALVANDINTTAVAELVYDGTEFQLLNPQVTPCGTILTGTFADNVTPTGTCPTTTLTLPYSPNPTASLSLYYNGQLLTQGSSADYTLSSATVTLANSCPSGSVFVASFRH